MINHVPYVFLGIAAMFWVTPPAQAATCADHGVIVQRLAAIYGETRQSAARDPAGTMVEVFAAKDTGSWTITVTGQDARTCLVAAGQAFNWRKTWQSALEEQA